MDKKKIIIIVAIALVVIYLIRQMRLSSGVVASVPIAPIPTPLNVGIPDLDLVKTQYNKYTPPQYVMAGEGKG